MPPGSINKIWRIMRLTTVILIATFMQVTAASHAQKLTLNKKQVTLKELFKEIKTQTGYDVLWQTENLKTSQQIYANFNSTTLDVVMTKVMEGKNLEFKIDENTIVIKEKEQASFFENLKARFQAIDVKGKVLDENGQPLVGATVAIKGKNRSVKTDQYGVFFISNVEEKDVLVIRYVGYQDREVDATSDLGNLTLTVKDAELEEVKINAGYYSVTDRERTGNINRIDSKTIEKQVISNPLQSLQNRVTGLEITQNSGVPGGGFSVRIRGVNSFNPNGLEPLYIVDGTVYSSSRISSQQTSVMVGGGQGPSPLNFINPYDIANIEVLKDADATAIYGSRGANGVILITTKKGLEGSLSISGSLSVGKADVSNFVSLLNTEQYIGMRNEALLNDKLTPGPADVDINGIWDLNKYTNWQKEMIGKSGNLTNSSLSVTGGNKSISYVMSGNYYREGSVYPGNFGINRGGLHTSATLGSPNDRFSTVFSALYSSSSSTLPVTDPLNFAFLQPNKPDSYNSDGSLNWKDNVVNPMAELLRKTSSNTNNLIGNAELSYKPISGLIIRTSLSYNNLNRSETSITPLSSYFPTAFLTNNNRRSNFVDNFNKSWVIEPIVTYSTMLRSGKLEFLLGSWEFR